jgi:ubiquinone/menaquinone biosynthesis C-methylase UbiE
MNQIPLAATNADTRFWDRAARKYSLSPISDVVGYERTLNRVEGFLGSSDKVLELGCGTGTTALRLAPSVGHYHATDISMGMVEIAHEKLAAEPQPRLTFAAATVETNSIPAGGYDAVLAFNYLHLVEDVGTTLARIRDLVRPGGLFIAKTALISELNFAIRLAIPVMRLVGKAPKNVRALDESALLDALAHAGFVVESAERHGVDGKDPRLFTVARRIA